MNTHKNHLQLVALSLMWGIQLTIILAQVLSAQTPHSALSATVVPEWLSLLRPEWETLLYRFFIASTIGAAIFWHFLGTKIISIRRYIIIEALLTVALLGACFKISVYAAHPDLAKRVLFLLSIVAFLIKALWPWVCRCLDAIAQFCKDKTNETFLDRALMLAMPIIIFLIIDVPNISGVVARFFVGEQFHHNDSFIFGPAWAYVSGCRLDWDIISQYGVGVGAIFGSLGQLFGGFTYESGLQMMIWGAIIYYTLWFFLMRAWLKSTILAAAGVFLVLEFQLFNAGVYPFAFTYGSATVLRNWFDIFVMISILMHIYRPAIGWLIMGAVACGLQLFYIPSDGVYLLAMFAFYVFYWVWHNGLMRRIGYLGVLMVPPIVMIVCMFIFIGPVVATKQFWNNTSEFVAYFLNGFGLTPIYSGLQDRQFLASLMGFVLPIVYVLALLVVGTLIVLKKISQRHIFACVIGVYGLCVYHYYVARSGPSSYYVVSLPFVMILMFGVSCYQRRLFHVIVLSLSIALLVLNQNFIAYPNRLSPTRNPLTDVQIAQPLSSGEPYFNHLYRGYNEALKVPVNSLGDNNEAIVAEGNFTSDDALLSYYKAESDFGVDADLIDRLTGPQEPVALISSFEIKMLMDAKRRPYFYYFPLSISHPLRSRTLVRSSIYTIDQLNKVIDRLSNDKPQYVFVERLLTMRPLSEQFYFYYSSMLYVTDFVFQNYEPVAQGKYLVAYKLKGST